MFSAHMAGLAEAYEIGSNVSSLSTIKKPKWPDVVNRKTLPHVFTAIGATPSLVSYHLSARQSPAATTICLRASYPARRCTPNKYSTAFKTKSTAKPGASILLCNPWLLVKVIFAVFTRNSFSINPSWVSPALHVGTSEGICWPLARAKFIANQVSFRAIVKEFFCLPRTSARSGAESRFFFSVRFYAEQSAACFACFINHIAIIEDFVRGSIGSGTALEAYRQPDFFVQQPSTKAEQGGFEF